MSSQLNIVKLKNRITRHEKKIESLENSVSIRIGRHIVKSIRQPWRIPFLLFSLPYVAIFSGMDYLQRKKNQNDIMETGHKNSLAPIEPPVLSKENQLIYEQLEPHFCNEERHNFEYELMSILHKFFRKRNIDYWAIGGTLLGQVKYSGTIPWDHDIDIFVECLPRSIEDEMMDELSLIEGCSIRKWLWDNRRPGIQIHDMRAGNNIAIDIFYGHFHENTIYSIGMNVEKFPEKGRQGIDRIINPGIRTVNFGNTLICVPTLESTEEYLNWKFGEDWLSEYVIFDFKEKTSISFPANHHIDEMLMSFVVNRSLK